MSKCPLARSSDLVVEPLDDELLVFDERVGRAHSLNASATAVWRACDGTRTREQLAAECGLDPLAVELALESLTGCDLLVDFTPTGERVSRRAALRRMAVTGATLGVALPVIRSIAAPSAQAAAVSGSKAGNRCTSATNANNSCSATSRCHSDSLCHPGSTCATNPEYANQNPPGSCGSHPCCQGLHCASCSTSRYQCHSGNYPCF